MKKFNKIMKTFTKANIELENLIKKNNKRVEENDFALKEMQKVIEKDNRELNTETSFATNAKNAIANILGKKEAK